jgi:hypothetical protein
MTPMKSTRGSGQDYRKVPFKYEKIGQDKNLGPVLHVMIETPKGNKDIRVVVDTATDYPLALPWDIFREGCGFGIPYDRTRIVIPEIMECHTLVYCSKRVDVNIMGRELINRLVLLLDGPQKSGEIRW